MQPYPEIGGLEKVSTIDYPGKVAAVIFLRGCNFHCPYCHNPDLVNKTGQVLSLIDTWQFLESRQGLLDGVVISGGEPCYTSDIESMLEAIKNLGFSIKLDTNGSFPDVLTRLITKNLIDYVALDLKADPTRYSTSFADTSVTERVKYSIGVLKSHDIPHEYRTTVALPYVTTHDMKSIAKMAAGDWPLYLQEVKTDVMLNPEFIKSFSSQPDKAALEDYKAVAREYLPTFIR
jgi:pyruvate formate lyase activating enzyme